MIPAKKTHAHPSLPLGASGDFMQSMQVFASEHLNWTGLHGSSNQNLGQNASCSRSPKGGGLPKGDVCRHIKGLLAEPISGWGWSHTFSLAYRGFDGGSPGIQQVNQAQALGVQIQVRSVLPYGHPGIFWTRISGTLPDRCPQPPRSLGKAPIAFSCWGKHARRLPR